MLKMSEELYEQAIADARKIREVAEENAKKAVLEAVTPKIKKFIEEQILEQESSEEKEEVEESADSIDLDETEMVELDESAITSLLNLVGGDINNLQYQSKKTVGLALKEAMNRLNSNERKQLLNMSQKINEASQKLNTESLNNKKEKTIMSGNEKYYEIDLALLREALEDEGGIDMPDLDDPIMGAEGEGEEPMEDAPAGDNMISKDDIEAQIEELIADLGLEIGGAADMDVDVDMPEMEEDEEMEEEEEEEEEAEPLEEVFDIDPRMLRRELQRIRESKGQALAHQSGGIAKDYEHHFGGKGSAGSKGGDFGGGKPGKDVLSEMRRALRNQRHQNGALQNKLTKYRSAVKTLREQLEELNLFNAKLLYVNKLLQNKTISESQKRSIVQALDEAKDLREAKVLYKSLTESFSVSKNSERKTLSESKIIGGSSRATKSGSSSNQAAGEMDRWAKLAGLK